MRERGPRVLGGKKRKEKEIFQENKNTPWFFDLLAAGKTADHAFQILFAMHRKPPAKQRIGHCRTRVQKNNMYGFVILWNLFPPLYNPNFST